MKFKTTLILYLLVIVIAAPILDAIACNDCTDNIPVCNRQQCLMCGADQAGVNVLSSDAARTAQQETGTTQDLCPLCSNIAAAMGNACCGAPALISYTNHLPKLIALSSPSYPINKPPQN